MVIKAKRDVSYDYENYGIDFYKDKIYQAKKVEDCYYAETESGSEVALSKEDLRNDFDTKPIKCYVKDIMNFGYGNTLYPFETLICCGAFGAYIKVKKSGKGNRKTFLIRKNKVYFD